MLGTCTLIITLLYFLKSVLFSLLKNNTVNNFDHINTLTLLKEMVEFAFALDVSNN